ncbi:lipocalin family protein [Pedobacter xixiisoli]|uniref:Lipocalin-like domain-containing protein n=1 Tax=Pedobacter xixiisoli TaxID=1476464 RepID=A0A285ZSB5_9SPHI|nr:lipocalin family protein [Pedobacter xixiisoli]SOD12548.1 Lipocalin-like domain-containing protein [Pedobacter xixiisoli]
MKKATLLLLLAITSILSACKKDEAERNSDRLIGRWKVESVAYIEFQNNKETQREQYSNLELAWEFRNDGTATVNFDSDEEVVGWTATNDMLQLTRGDDQRLDFKINSLTKSNLHVIFEDRNRVIDGITYRETVEFTLRK